MNNMELHPTLTRSPLAFRRGFSAGSNTVTILHVRPGLAGGMLLTKSAK